MCVLALAWRSHPRWPLVLAGNRDERHDRPAAPLARWPEAPEVLGGRDLEGGGTWLGVSEAGRLAVVTNLRGFGGPRPGAPSRGLLTRDVLMGRGRYAEVEADELAAFNPMNLIAVADGQARFLTNRPVAAILPLAAGLHGLSNGELDDPWPKTRRVKAALAAWLEAGDAETDALFAALADRSRPPDEALPSTGLGIERERQVSAVFVEGEVYGTRCSTVVRIDSGGQGEILERRYAPGGEVLGETALPFIWPTGALGHDPRATGLSSERLGLRAATAEAAASGTNAMRKTIWIGGALAGLAAMGAAWAGSALAQDKSPGPAGARQCFYARDISSWAPVDRSTVNLRVHVNEIYQLKLLGDCPNIDWINGIGLEHRGSSWICTGLDAELLVPQPGGGHGFPLRCPVSSIRKLSKEEAKALPPKQHP